MSTATASTTAAPKRPARKPRGTAAHWPAWTDNPIPYRLAEADAEFRLEVEDLARARGGMHRLVGHDAD